MNAYEPTAEDIQAYNLDQELMNALARSQVTPVASIRTKATIVRPDWFFRMSVWLSSRVIAMESETDK